MIQLKRRSKRNLLIGFGFSLIILILSSAFSYISITQLLASQRAVEHTAQVESDLNNLISRMKDAETGQRGFLLTGNAEFLEPYNGARVEIGEYFNHVQLLTADNAPQQKDFPLLKGFLETKFQLIEKSIIEKKRGIPPTVQGLIIGKQAMDSVRTVVSRMIARENKLMVSGHARMNKFAAFTPVLIGIAALLSMAITILFYFRVSRDADIAVKLQRELREKEEKTSKQIDVIDGVAKRIAAGDYTARIAREDLE